MSKRQCQGIESLFDQRLAAAQLERMRRRGPLKTTRLLIEALRARGVKGWTLLDIGGGVGAVQHQLLASGVREATDVDASSAYLRTARSEAERLGFEGRVLYHYGDFLDLAHGIPPADKTHHLYGLVYPRDVWWTGLGIRFINLGHVIRGNKFRVFAHRTAAVESILARRGLKRSYHRTAGLWQVAVFAREAAHA